MHDLQRKGAFISDMDGVVYHGSRLLPGAKEFVEFLEERELPYLFLTNSSERTPRELAEKLVPGNWIQFDMEYCETMDSTFMGVLTMLALKLRKSSSPQIMLINASVQLNKLLRDLGVAKLFKFVSGDDAAAVENGGRTGSAVSLSNRKTLLDTAQTVVDAHKTLVEAESSNAEKFNQVIEFAEQDVRRLKGQE